MDANSLSVLNSIHPNNDLQNRPIRCCEAQNISNRLSKPSLSCY